MQTFSFVLVHQTRNSKLVKNGLKHFEPNTVIPVDGQIDDWNVTLSRADLLSGSIPKVKEWSEYNISDMPKLTFTSVSTTVILSPSYSVLGCYCLLTIDKV